MIINGKSALIAEELKDRRDRGFQNFEIHLFETQPFYRDNIKKYLKMIKKSGMTPRVVHAPMYEVFNVEGLHHEDELFVMENALHLAQEISKTYHQKTYFVIHMDLSMTQIKRFRLIDGITRTFRKWLQEYPDVEFLFENLPMVSLEDGRVNVRNSYQKAPYELAKYLNAVLNTSRFGMVLDTCHSLSTEKIMKLLGQNYTLEEYIKSVAPLVKLVHLAGIRDFGFSEGHGVDFETEEELLTYHRLLKLIKKHIPDGMITIETSEVDKGKAERMSSVLKLLKSTL